MRRMKRVLSLLLVLCMVFAMVPSFAMAADGTTAVGYTASGSGEVLYKYNATEQDPANHVYASAEAAFAAALQAWKSGGANGTVKLYENITLTGIVADVGSTGDKSYIIEIGAGENLTIDLAGKNLIIDAAVDTTHVFKLSGSAVLTINGNGGAFGAADTIVQNANSSIVMSTTDFSGVGTFNNINVDRNGTLSAVVEYNGADSSKFIFNGGFWDACGIVTSTASTTTDLYFMGGITIAHDAGYAIRIGSANGANAYISDAVIYSANNTRKTPDTGYGMVAERGESGTVYADISLTLGTGDPSDTKNYSCEINGTGTATPIDGTLKKKVYAHTVKGEGGSAPVFNNEATFWTGEAADNAVECATLKEALEMLNKDDRARTGKEVITLLKNVDIANRAGTEAYFTDGYSNASLTYAIHVTKGGFTLDLDGNTIRTSGAFMQTYVNTNDQTAFDAFTTDALKTITIKNGTILTSCADAGTQNNDDSVGCALLDNYAGNVVLDGIKYLGKQANTVVMQNDTARLGTLTVSDCELFAVGLADGSNYVLGSLEEGNTFIVNNSKLGIQNGKVLGMKDSVSVSGSTILYYTGDDAFVTEPTYGSGLIGSVGTGSYTTSTGLVMTDAKTWSPVNASSVTKAVGFTGAGSTEVEYYVGYIADPSGRVYTSCEEAFAAALAEWDAAGAGTVTLYESGVITGNVAFPGGENNYLVGVGNNESLTLNFANGVSLKTADGYSGGKALVNVSDNGVLTVNGGTITWNIGSYRGLFETSDATNVSFTGTATFNNVTASMTGGTSFVVNFGLGGKVIIDGGLLKTYTDSGSGAGYVFTIVNVNAVNSATKVYLRGGVESWIGQKIAIRCGANGLVYAEDAVLYTMPGYESKDGIYGIAGYAYINGNSVSSKYDKPVVVLGNDGGAESKLAVGSKTAFTEHANKQVSPKTVTLDSKIGSESQTSDSVVKSESTNLYYNVNDFIRYLAKAEKDDVLTAVADIDGTTSAYYAANGVLPTLSSVNYVTLELGNYTVNCPVEAKGGITINGGTILGDVVVNGGEMTLNDTDVSGFVKIISAGKHLVTGGSIYGTECIELGADVILTVSGGTVINASNGLVAKGNGSIILKNATVKFATGIEPFGTPIVEGSYEESADNGVTTRVYTPAGDTVQGDNVAMLVESGTYFPTVAEAIKNASKLFAETVKLVAASNEAAAVTVDKTVELDLNENTVFAEFTVTDGTVLVKNGTIATAANDSIVITGGSVTLENVEVQSAGSALVVNDAAAVVNVVDSNLTGATSNGVGYGLYVVNAAAVTLSNTNVSSGSKTLASIALDNGVSAGVVTLESGTVNIPAAYVENNQKWADGQDYITSLVNTISRYPYDVNVQNVAAGTTASNSCYILTASTPAAMIGKVSYSTLKDAVAASAKQSGCEITLMRDIDLDDDTEFGADSTARYLLILNNVTLNLNGFSIHSSDKICTNTSYSSKKNSPFQFKGTVTVKNGFIHNEITKDNSTFQTGTNGSYLILDNVYIKCYPAGIATSTGCSSVGVKMVASTIESYGYYTNYNYGLRFTYNANTDIQPGLQLTMLEGSKLIGTGGGLCLSAVLDLTNPGVFNLDNAYIYNSTTANELMQITNAPAEPYMEGSNYVYYYSSTSTPVATIGSNEYFSVAAALTAAKSGDTVTVQRAASVAETIAVASGVTLDLNGADVTVGSLGSLTVESGAVVTTNGGELISSGNVQFKAGANVNGYTFASDSLLHTDLNMEKVSLSMNEYVDINLKFATSNMAGFSSVAVKVDGSDKIMAKTANGYDVYKIENLKASDYATGHWVMAEGTSGLNSYVGMPKLVSVKAYALSVVNDANYGYVSELGRMMTALMDYAGADMINDFGNGSETNANHTDIADYGTKLDVTNGTITASADIANGYVVNFNVTAAGELLVKHTDIYGNEFTQPFTVAAGDNVTYVMTHVADAKQTITATLTLADGTTSTLETTLATVVGTADKAIIASNCAETFFTGA